MKPRQAVALDPIRSDLGLRSAFPKPKKVTIMSRNTLVLPTLAIVIGGFACVSMQEAHQRHVQRLCSDRQYAYETGYNSGMNRERLDTSWVDTSCAPEVRQEVRNNYLTGYETGAQNAPAVEVHQVEAAASAVQSCRFSSDCGEDMSCRRWRGDKVCMGFGSAGDPCWFGSDCLSERCNASAKTCR